MPTYMARSEWNGSLKEGGGRLSVGSGAFEAALSPKPREGQLTNPEEVVGAALAGCYTLMLTRALTDEGHDPKRVRTSAAVELEHREGRPRIPKISLDVQVEAEGLSEEELSSLSQQADEACPVSQALGGTSIEINTRLPKGAAS